MNRRVLSIAVVALLLLLGVAWAQQQPAANPPAGTKSEAAAKPQEPVREKTAQESSADSAAADGGEAMAGAPRTTSPRVSRGWRRDRGH